METAITQLLEKHHLRKTDIRRRVLRAFMEAGSQALTNNDLETLLEDADRITLYRTLKTFEQKGLIHQAVDKSHSTKYALCTEECSEHDHHDEHAHFHCQDCGKTVCIEGKVQSKVEIPAGFKVKQTHLVLEGTCSDCR